MPEMSGPEPCQAIRGHDFPGYVFIILVTAKDTNDDIVEGLEAGTDDYLIKPINQAELVARFKAGKRVLRLERSLKETNEKISILSPSAGVGRTDSSGEEPKKVSSIPVIKIEQQ